MFQGSKGESMESWAEISGRSLSCRHGARWDLEQVFTFSPAGIRSSKKWYHWFYLLLLLLLLFFFILSEEDSERMRKNNNINKKSNAPFWLYFEWEKLFWGGQCGKKITRVFPADDQKDSKTSQSGPLLQDSEGKVAWELDVQFWLLEILCSN